MAFIGYHASHEQFRPSELVRFVREAEQAGFAGIMSSDHLAPWSMRQGQSGAAWSWLGAAMQATALPFGIITVPSGWRYHPVIIAQAAATLAEMFPGRFPWLAVGSGEALNEHVTGGAWPPKDERNRRLLAAVEAIRALWRGQTVSASEPIRIDQARLHTLPPQAPRMIAGALSAETAGWAGRWADGLITVNQDRASLAGIIEAFRGQGGKGQLLLQLHVSLAENEETARVNAFDQWRSNAITAETAENLRFPEEFDKAARNVRPEDMDRHVRISADPAEHRRWLEQYLEMGFEQIYVHNVGRNQSEFIEAYGKSVLPALSPR